MTAYPLPFFLLVLGAVLTTRRLASRGQVHALTAWEVRAAEVLAVTSTAVLVLCAGTYLALGSYFDHIEPSVAALSWLWARGETVYLPAGSPRVYSLLYGPMTYVVNGTVMLLLGASTFSAKVAGVLSVPLALVLRAPLGN